MFNDAGTLCNIILRAKISFFLISQANKPLIFTCC